MKRYFHFLMMLLATVMLMTSCNEFADHPVSGHVYEHKIDIQDKHGDWTHTTTKVTFHRSGKCTHYYYSNQLSFKSDTETHLDWKIEGSDVVIYYDHSTTWKSTARGKEWKRYTYNASNNTLESGTAVYKCVE